MKPMSKPPGTKHLKLKCDIVLSTSAFKFNFRRYAVGAAGPPPCATIPPVPGKTRRILLATSSDNLCHPPSFASVF